MEVLLAALPLVTVVFLMAGPWSLPAVVALPATAALAGLLRLVFFEAGLVEMGAASVAGLVAACTPILIVGGAVALFQNLERAGALAIWRAWLDSLNPHPVARLMTVAWAFAYLVEGASGFGTPAALAAPILVACGMPALRAAIICLILNSVPVTFGAIGTPVWFGLSELDLPAAVVTTIGARAGIINAVIALPVVVVCLLLVLHWATIRSSLVFIALSVAGCVVPAAIVAQYGAEFPSLVGGGVGLLVTVLAARFGVGLGELAEADRLQAVSEAEDAASAHAAGAVDQPSTTGQPPPPSRVLRAFSPLIVCVGLLVLTRLPFLPLKDWLVMKPQQLFDLGVMQAGISAGGTLVVADIFGTGAGQTLHLLFVPGVIPFLLVAAITPLLLGNAWSDVGAAFAATRRRLQKPILALVAGLILVKFLQFASSEAPAFTTILGQAMATWLGPVWTGVAPFLGALGSFFSGSNTMSNLTFAPVQLAAARELGLDHITILALQTIGGGMGNMVCVHNIVAATSILGIDHSEGIILRRTIWPLIAYGLLAAAGAWLLGVAGSW